MYVAVIARINTALPWEMGIVRVTGLPTLLEVIPEGPPGPEGPEGPMGPEGPPGEDADMTRVEALESLLYSDFTNSRRNELVHRGLTRCKEYRRVELADRWGSLFEDIRAGTFGARARQRAPR